MRIAVLEKDKNLNIETSSDQLEKTIKEINEILDHATFQKEKVDFNEKDKILSIRIIRNRYENIKRKVLWFNIWLANKDPKTECLFVIKDITKVVLSDLSDKKDHQLGGIIYKENKISIVPFCSHEDNFLVEVMVSRLNLTIEDVG